MRTTIDLPDHLFRETKARAALEGITLKDLITRFVDQGLRRVPEPTEARKRSQLPVIRPATGRSLPALSHAQAQALLEQEDVDGFQPD